MTATNGTTFQSVMSAAGCILAALAAFLSSLLYSGYAEAQIFPTKPVRVIVGGQLGPGQAPLRIITEHLTKVWGVAVIMESRPGGNGTIAVEAAVNAEPDGHTLLHVGASITAMKALNPTIPYDPLTALAPIGLTVETVTFFVTNTQVPATNVAGFVEYAKKNPGKLNYGTIGRNTLTLALEGFQSFAGLDMIEVPYAGEGAYVVGLVRNDVQLVISSYLTILPHLQAGALRPLMAFGERRWPALPDVPSAAEAGFPKIPSVSWFGLMAPAKTPRHVIDKISTEVRVAYQDPAAKEFAEKAGVHLLASTPDEHAARISREAAQWADILKLEKVKPTNQGTRQ